MENQVNCLYCKYFMGSKSVRKDAPEEISGKKKKKSPSLLKRCSATRKKIDMDSHACQYFDPNDIFYCDRHRIRIHIAQCINRRRNSSSFETYKKCKKCRQFESVIKPIAEDYFLSARKAIPPKKQIRRRAKPEKVESKITRRRKLKKEKSKITRRSKVTRRKKSPSGKITRR